MAEKTAGTSYILNFYRDVILLTHYVATYMNMIAEIEFKYSDFDMSKMDTEEKNSIINNVQMVRYYGNKCKIECKSLKKLVAFSTEDLASVDRLNGELNDVKKFVIERDTASAFAEVMNALLVNDVIQNVLETNLDVMQSLFGENERQNTQFNQSQGGGQSYPV